MQERWLIRALAQAAKEAREAADIKQVRIAATLSVDQSTIARFENGNWPREPEAMLRAYSEETGRSPERFVTRACEILLSDNGDGMNGHPS